MKSLEGITINEIKESELEKKSINITDEYDFDDCALTEKDKLQKLKQDLINARATQNTTLDFDKSENYDDCGKNEVKESELEKGSVNMTDEYDFDDCALTEKDKLQKLKQDLINARATQNTTLDFDKSENYDDCGKNEVKESELEKGSVNMTDEYDFDDCALTEKDKLQKLKQDLINAVIAQNTTLDFDESENYDNCRKNVR